MDNRKFKVGDKVRIINASSIEPYELNEVGIISGRTRSTYVVDMGRLRRPGCSEDSETCWWLQEKHIELASKPNEQLLFSFMY